MEAADLLVCDDCAYAITHGPETDAQTAAYDAFIEQWGNVRATIDCGESGECYGFSYGDCEGCGSTLGGTRHYAYFI